MDDDGGDLPLPVGAIRLRLVLPRLPSHATGAGGSPPRVEAKDSLTIVARQSLVIDLVPRCRALGFNMIMSFLIALVVNVSMSYLLPHASMRSTTA
ncbi:hypothetical protein OsI_19435 [Oryza sativa Indica Group]|uniref:Uncharacterized protein n=1 Tax=Oryza sativa subsp. indica TaxID=39946 RepID=B8AWK4_ORYSI|nr:hypothetical protein OsI_19435 [Oryza sativa Indica Group]